MASRITVNRLRSLLSERGLPTDGFKPVLIERCRANGVALSGRDDESAPTPSASPGSGTPNSGWSGPVLAASTAVEGVRPDASCNRAIHPDGPAAPAATTIDGADPTARPGAVGAASSSFSLVAAGQAQNLSSTFAAPAVPADTVGLVGEGSPPLSRVGSSPRRAPNFKKHEKARLAHILCTPEVAAGVVTSRGVMSRQQMDARTSRGAVWVVVVASTFNSSDTFDVLSECADGGINPNLHPHVRTGETLKSKWIDVRCNRFSLLLAGTVLLTSRLSTAGTARDSDATPCSSFCCFRGFSSLTCGWLVS